MTIYNGIVQQSEKEGCACCLLRLLINAFLSISLQTVYRWKAC